MIGERIGLDVSKLINFFHLLFKIKNVMNAEKSVLFYAFLVQTTTTGTPLRKLLNKFMMMKSGELTRHDFER